MFKLLKRIFSRNDEDIQYSNEEYNSFFSNILNNVVITEEIKPYKGIKDFINKYNKGIEQIPLKSIKPTEEIVKFANQWKLLQYKCLNENLIKYINKVSSK
jgi:hypothetical protein